MKKIKLYIIVIAVLLTSTVSCQSNTLPDELNISVSDLKESMSTDSSLVILDVRTPQELKGELGQIEGVINIPVQVLSERINELEKYRDKNIAVICRSGNRSVLATKILQENGYKAKNVLGGMRAFNKL